MARSAKQKAARRQAKRILRSDFDFVDRNPGPFGRSDARASLRESQESIASNIEKITRRKRRNRELRSKRKSHA